MSKAYIYLTDSKVLENKEMFNKIYNEVNPIRKEKTDKLQIDSDKYLSLAAEYCLIEASKEFGVDYKKEEIEIDINGKPHYKNIGIDFNLAHSGTKAMCIISNNKVGCDIELIRKVNINVAKRFSENEYKKILEDNSKFFRFWTLKESFMKCIGLGLGLPLNSFEIDINNHIVIQDINDKKYYTFEFDIKDYKCSCCIENNINELIFKEIEIK